MLTIDGSVGEGGGQILRTTLSLSLITQTPVRITSIRKGRARPGLMRQHLTSVQAAAQIGRAEVRGHPDAGLLAADGDEPAGDPRPEQRAGASEAVAVGGHLESGAAVMAEAEVDLRVGHGEPRDELGDVRGLRRVALEELEPGRQVEQQIGHLDRGAGGRADLRYRQPATGLVRDPRRGQVLGAPRGQHDPRDAGDRR